jgi:predicted glutamine amidotransferase
MCVFCVVPPNVIPTKTILEDSALNNPDGFGFAICIPSENRIHVEKTMNADTSISRFLEMRTKYPQGYAMWHARIATHGSVTVDNCHPFYVANDNRTVLFHNGVLPIDEPKGDTRSDTRIFAEDILPAIGGVKSLDNDKVFTLVEGFATGSKLAVMTLDPEAKHQVYMINENAGFYASDGIWWSNTTCYLSYNYGKSKYSYDGYFGMGLTKDDKVEGHFLECFVCDSYIPFGLAEDINKCFTCGSCYECGTYYKECLCYSPKSSKAKDIGWSTSHE